MRLLNHLGLTIWPKDVIPNAPNKTNYQALLRQSSRPENPGLAFGVNMRCLDTSSVSSFRFSTNLPTVMVHLGYQRHAISFFSPLCKISTMATCSTRFKLNMTTRIRTTNNSKASHWLIWRAFSPCFSLGHLQDTGEESTKRLADLKQIIYTWRFNLWKVHRSPTSRKKP